MSSTADLLLRERVPTTPGGFLRRLSSGERAALRLLGREVRIPAGTAFLFQGDHPDRVMILGSGHAKLTRVSASGHETLLAIRDPGDLIGQEAATDARCVGATATALTDIEALVIPRAAFVAQLDRAPRLMLALLEAVSDECAELAGRWTDRASQDTLGRVAGCLVELADRYGRPHPHGTAIALPIRQDDLAAWTGASRAATAKALQTLRRLGWISTGRTRSTVENPRALRQRAA